MSTTTPTASTTDHIRWIEHNGQRILHVAYGGLATPQMLEVLESLASIARDSPTKIRVLLDLREAYGSKEFMDRTKQIGQEVLKQKVERTAALGVSGLKLILIRGYRAALGGSGFPEEFFDNEQEALDWLAQR